MSVPPKFRMISPTFTISSPIREEDVAFLHKSGCRKLITLAGAFVTSGVLQAVKKRSMHVEHFPLDLESDEASMIEHQVRTLIDKVSSLCDSGSRFHLVCGPDMLEAAFVTALIRQICDEWDASSALIEALEINNFVNYSTLARVVLGSDVSRWKDLTRLLSGDI